jgi:hypothetical protein
LRPGLARSHPPIRAATFLLLWEWFRIYFESGVAKIASGDPQWRHFTAMDEYYQNGPLPTWLGWYAQHLPHWFHASTVFLTLAVELVLVWTLFMPRRARIACFFIVTPLQLGIILTANYAFLNYLVLVLGFLLLDDRLLVHFLPRIWEERHWSGCARSENLSGPPNVEHASKPSQVPFDSQPFLQSILQPIPQPIFWSSTKALSMETSRHEEPGKKIHDHNRTAYLQRPYAALKIGAAVFIFAWLFYATAAQMLWMFWPGLPLPTTPVTLLEPARIAGRYGLFAVMTRGRYEIEFQGSQDGQNWTAYPFRFKPQDPAKAPGIYAPYQPRFDWNLWFASLGEWRENPLVPRTEERLLAADPDVLALFAANPFPQQSPSQVRAVLWQYWFTTPQEKRAQGTWWRRELLGLYAPTLQRGTNGKLGVVEWPTPLPPHE